jgi:hypothetical protein
VGNAAGRDDIISWYHEFEEVRQISIVEPIQQGASLANIDDNTANPFTVRQQYLCALADITATEPPAFNLRPAHSFCAPKRLHADSTRI